MPAQPVHGRTAILRSIAMEDGRSHHQFNDSTTPFVIKILRFFLARKNWLKVKKV